MNGTTACLCQLEMQHLMLGIYFHIFEQIMSSSEIYHIFDVSLSTYFLLGNVQI